MNNDTAKAREMLGEGYTCVILRGERVYTSRERGVRPLLTLLDSGESFVGFFAADKVVGRAAAFLYVLLGVSELYAALLSDGALEILNRYGIDVSYDRRVSYVLNRAGTGPCPMELATANIRDAEDARGAIEDTLRALGERAKK